MITSAKQYAVAQDKIAMLRESLDKADLGDVPEIIKETKKGQLQSLIAEMQAEIDEYETLTAAGPDTLEIVSLDDLMAAPIRYRIASGLSVEKFGQLVDVGPRQIHRYEAANYGNATTATLTKILGRLELNLQGKVSVGTVALNKEG